MVQSPLLVRVAIRGQRGLEATEGKKETTRNVPQRGRTWSQLKMTALGRQVEDQS